MLLERLSFIPDEEARMLRDKLSAKSELNLQDPNTAVTELMRAIVYREFKTICNLILLMVSAYSSFFVRHPT